MWGKYGSISIGPLIGRKRPSPLAISLCFPSPSVQKGLEVATQSRNCMHHIFMQLCLAHKVPARKAEWLVTQKGQDLPDARCWNSCSALAHFCVGLKFLFIFCATCFHLSALTNTKLSEINSASARLHVHWAMSVPRQPEHPSCLQMSPRRPSPHNRTPSIGGFYIRH